MMRGKMSDFGKILLVNSEPHVIFYAGVPLVSDTGFPLGTLCVIDSEPRELSQCQVDALKVLSSQAMSLFSVKKNSLVKGAVTGSFK